ncbi:GNAT family N-acetyltransferase [Pseudodonghicola flavimaris]|uniref:GNAT family N-acetyltransferase n=1 Tax=Pseudodonghicola flavimaris TaxID=3050036 RepID=A0ABT7F3J9_9RHOB|nr:GNAT family N-acetyltransferase [Pseudodonghicola flavimaris]MDK3019195.1 GNAT family N-acetyltransferase [Pseudodonghicola flavimaris]
MIETRVLTGAALDAALDPLADLRIAVFRDWPYLYDGDREYERTYLQSYRDSTGAILVGAFDGDRLIGAATGTPLSDHADDFAAAFDGQDYPLDQVFYCAESVLLAEYRGHGIGHRFFDAREDHARRLGLRYCAFCAVQRPADHPLKPAGYRPLDPFWRRRGYTPLPGSVAWFGWKDIDQTAETQHPLQVWIRSL